ncbi:hypothetical protein NDU88_010844 [Pleurodeles waltl]|uniref:Uncharacterized protein n=1 Tax=Pleurodeles waltl TaxID=8319 RepID=A0AAV7S4J6_PLEWA|nr:hypothetical protein NDU88_010844 [Pleurodeles waltl]
MYFGILQEASRHSCNRESQEPEIGEKPTEKQPTTPTWRAVPSKQKESILQEASRNSRNRESQDPETGEKPTEKPLAMPTLRDVPRKWMESARQQELQTHSQNAKQFLAEQKRL